MQFVEDVTLFGLGYDGWTGHSEVSSVTGGRKPLAGIRVARGMNTEVSIGVR
jgi:hypothetical protein